MDKQINKRSLFQDERGVMGYAYAYIIVVVFCIIIFGIIAVLLSNFGTSIMVGLQPMQESTKATALLIHDANISASIIASVDNATALQQTNIEIMQLLYSFIGILTIVILGIVYFLYTQKNVEANRGLGGGLQ